MLHLLLMKVYSIFGAELRYDANGHLHMQYTCIIWNRNPLCILNERINDKGCGQLKRYSILTKVRRQCKKSNNEEITL